MKKKISLMVAILGIVCFTVSCSDGRKSSDVIIQGNSTDGSADYDFTGKVLTYVDTTSVTKTVTNYSYSATVAPYVTTATTTTTIIPFTITTNTFTFNADKTFTAKTETAYAAGIDNVAFTNATVLDAQSRASIVTSYSTAYGTLSGYSGKVTSSTTITGTWEMFSNVEKTGELKAFEYKIKPIARTNVTNSSTGAAAYALSSTVTTSYTYVMDATDYDTFGYTWDSTATTPIFRIQFGTLISTYLSNYVDYAATSL